MSSGKRDNNRVVVVMGVSSVDGVTPIPLTVDPDTGRLRMVYVGSSSSGVGVQPAKRDNNRVKCMLGAKSTDNNIPIPISISTVNNGLLVAP